MKKQNETSRSKKPFWESPPEDWQKEYEQYLDTMTTEDWVEQYMQSAEISDDIESNICKNNATSTKSVCDTPKHNKQKR